MATEVKGVVETLQALTEVGKTYETEIKKIIFLNSVLLATHAKKFMRGGTTSTHLKFRSGRLQSSTHPFPVKKVGDTLIGGIRFGTKYAIVHIAPAGKEDRKTTIRPKKAGGFLTVPIGEGKEIAERLGLTGQTLGSTLTKAGVSRGSAMSGKYHNTFIQKSKTGRLIIFGAMKQVQFAGQKQKIVPLFLLVKKVTIPSRINASSLVAWIKPKLEDDIQSIKMGGLKPI